jgi:hypothetical protein
MQLNPVRFVMLQFSRDPRSTTGLTLLILQSKEQLSLEVLVRPDWKQRVDAADQAFLSELMEEWMSIPPTEVSRLFDELCRQSNGPLRVLRQGQMPVSDHQPMVPPN